jgi:hypothetical protein
MTAKDVKTKGTEGNGTGDNLSARERSRRNRAEARRQIDEIDAKAGAGGSEPPMGADAAAGPTDPTVKGTKSPGSGGTPAGGPKEASGKKRTFKPKSVKRTTAPAEKPKADEGKEEETPAVTPPAGRLRTSIKTSEDRAAARGVIHVAAKPLATDKKPAASASRWRPYIPEFISVALTAGVTIGLTTQSWVRSQLGSAHGLVTVAFLAVSTMLIAWSTWERTRSLGPAGAATPPAGTGPASAPKPSEAAGKAAPKPAVAGGDARRKKGQLTPEMKQALNEELLAAAREGASTSEIDGLLAKGAELEATDKTGQTSLAIVAKSGDTELVGYFIAKNANPNAKDKQDRTVLMGAVLFGQEEAAEMVLDAGALVNEKDKSGKTALMCAPTGSLAQLLVGSDATVDEKDNDERTAMSWAAGKGKIDVAEVLKNEGANVSEPDKNGKTPLMHAEENGHAEMAEWLRENGATE